MTFTAKEYDPETGLYYFGARYYDPKLSRWVSVDRILDQYLPKGTSDFDDAHDYYYIHSNDKTSKLKGMGGVYNTPNLDLYMFTHQNPIKIIDPDGNDAVAIVFPDYIIRAVGGTWTGLGHAGILLIDNKSGNTAYYEYGRYDSAGLGIVKRRSVPNVVMDKKTGMPTKASLNRVLGIVSRRAGHGGRIEGAYVKNDNYNQMKKYASDRESHNADPRRKSYSILSNNCAHFMRDVLRNGGVDTPMMADPRPNSYIGELRGSSGFIKIDFTPPNRGRKEK